jgi:hypothetical protein
MLVTSSTHREIRISFHVLSDGVPILWTLADLELMNNMDPSAHDDEAVVVFDD